MAQDRANDKRRQYTGPINPKVNIDINEFKRKPLKEQKEMIASEMRKRGKDYR